MTLPSSDTPPADVPEADWAEQAVEADPLAGAGCRGRHDPARVRGPWSAARSTMPILLSRRRPPTLRTTTSAASSSGSLAWSKWSEIASDPPISVCSLTTL
mgnify:CR=1 FL=1